MPLLELPACTVDLDRGIVRRAGEEHPMTDKERSLLAYLAARPGRAVPKAELLQQVWGYRPGVRTHTLETNVYTLRRKIEAAPKRPEVLQTVRGVGYRLTASMPARPTLPPAPPDPLIARDALLDELLDLIQGASRCVQVVGPTGVGTSRLLLAASRRIPPPQTVLYVAPTSPSDLARAVIAQLPGPRPVQAPEYAVLTALHARAPVVLILDEGTAEVAPDLLPKWLDAVPDLTVVLGGRRPLALPGSPVLVVPPWSDETVWDVLTERSGLPREDLAPLVPHTGGLPRVVELMLARLRLLTPAELAARLAGGTLGDRALDRALDESVEALPPHARTALEALALAPDPLPIDDALALLPDDQDLGVVQQLFDHGLLHRQVVEGVSRLHLLAPLRARIRARGGPALRAARVRALEYLAKAANDDGLNALFGGDPAVVITHRSRLGLARVVLDGEQGERAARVALLGAMTLLWYEGDPREALRWCRAHVDRDEVPAPLRAKLRILEARALRQHQRFAEVQQTLEAARALGADPHQVDAAHVDAEVWREDPDRLHRRLASLLERGHHDVLGVEARIQRASVLRREARWRTREAELLDLATDLQDAPWSRLSAWVHRNIAINAISRRSALEEALAHLDAATLLADEVGGLPLQRGNLLLSRFEVHRDLGLLDRALADAEAGRRLAAQTGEVRLELFFAAFHAEAVALSGQRDGARQAFDKVRSRSFVEANRYLTAFAQVHLARLDLEHGRLPDAARLASEARATMSEAPGFRWAIHALVDGVEGAVALRRGQREAGIEALQRGIDTWAERGERAAWLLALGRAIREADDSDAELAAARWSSVATAFLDGTPGARMPAHAGVALTRRSGSRASVR